MKEEKLYLLRFWREGETDSVWRAVVEDVRKRERWGFTRLEELQAFLEACIEPDEPDED